MIVREYELKISDHQITEEKITIRVPQSTPIDKVKALADDLSRMYNFKYQMGRAKDICVIVTDEDMKGVESLCLKELHL